MRTEAEICCEPTSSTTLWVLCIRQAGNDPPVEQLPPIPLLNKKKKKMDSLKITVLKQKIMWSMRQPFKGISNTEM